MVFDPRKRALEQMALGGAVPFTGEVDVQTVPSGLPPTEFPTSDLDGGARPVPQAITTGDPQGASERDYYADALSEKHRRQFEQSLTGIGSGILEAFTGVGPSQESLRQRQEYAEEPLVTYLQKQKEADAAREAELQQARLNRPVAVGKPQLSTDPNSPESKRARLVARRSLEGLYTDEELEQLSEADIYRERGAIQGGTAALGREVSREGQVAQQKRFEQDFAQRAELAARREGLDWAQLSQRERLARMQLEEAKASRAQSAQEKIDAQTKDLAGELDKTGAAKFGEQYDEAKRIMAKYRGDIPGFGRVEGRLPAEMLSEDGRQLRFLVGQMLSEYRKGQTGAGMSDSERAEYGRITGLIETGNDADVVRGLDTLNRALGARVAGIEAGYKPEAVETYRSRLKPKASTPTRKPAATALPKDSTGQPTLDAPKPRRKRDKTGQLWEEQPDGTAKKVPG